MCIDFFSALRVAVVQSLLPASAPLCNYTRLFIRSRVDGPFELFTVFVSGELCDSEHPNTYLDTREHVCVGNVLRNGIAKCYCSV